jgi:hypothetical protein
MPRYSFKFKFQISNNFSIDMPHIVFAKYFYLLRLAILTNEILGSLLLREKYIMDFVVL